MTQQSDITSTDLIISMNDNKEEDDLEDGEIEDDEDDVPKIIEQTKKESRQLSQPVNNLTGDLLSSDKIIESIKTQSKKEKRNNFNRSSIVEDDWAGNVENAIAMALKKETIPSTIPGTTAETSKNTINKSDDDERRKAKKRKKRDNEREKRKKRHKTDIELDKPEEELDDYEMLCIRGGSPPPFPLLRHDEQESYDSSYSASSYESYDSNEPPRRFEERRQRRHLKDRRILRKRDKRRRGDGDSDNEDLRLECRANRKMELCKFYLMECCAKRDKCLYMHSDFPCKYYYLGIKCVMKDSCKFAHGKPLSDNLRTILLKHLETAPKEILGDFPRLSRDNAIKMLDTTHIKLLIDFGIKPMSQIQTQNINQIPFSSSNLSNKIPSLLEIITKPPSIQNLIDKNIEKERLIIGSSPSTLMGQSIKNDKPRRTRWCTQGNNNIKQPIVPPIPLKKSAIIPPPVIPITALPPSSSANYLSLKNLTGVITAVQIQKLEEIGIENLDQINQLTVAQLNELGLSINQIHDIQLNALNIKKLGLSTKNVANTPALSSVITKPQQLISNSHQDQNKTLPTSTIGGLSPFFCEIGTGGKDLDMRINPGQLNPPIEIGLGMQDVDMRVLPIIQQKSTKNYPPTSDNELNSVATIKSPKQSADTNEPCVIDYNNFLTKTTKKSSVVDYSQYLKDSNIENIILDSNGNDSDDQNQLKIEDFNELSHNSNHEDEEELQIDESWCPSDDDNKKPHEKHEKDEKTESVEKDESVENNEKDKKNINNAKENIDDNRDSVLEKIYADLIKTSDDYDNDKKNNGDDDDKDSSDAGTNDGKSQVDNQDSNNSSSIEGKTESVTEELSKTIENNNSNDENEKAATPSYAASLLPAIIEPVSINTYDLNLTNKLGNLSKIDVSTSVAQMLQQSRDSYTKTDKVDAESVISNNSKTLELSIKESRDPRLSRDPRSATVVGQSISSTPVTIGTEFRDPRNNFEYYTKSISESLPSTSSTAISSSITSSLSSTLPISSSLPDQESTSNRKLRKTIYDSSSNYDEDEDNSNKKSDKDMRIQPFFIDTESANGDIDFRLPFKPIMANYVPATEIDASISSHSPIEYKVVEIEIPIPDFREIRRSIPNQDSVLDPRIRRIFSMTEDLDVDCKQPQQSSLPSDSRSVRFDPRRVKEDAQKINLLSSTPPSLLSTSLPTILPSSLGKSNSLDIHLLLQKSLWYKDLSSKQKIMVNRHLAEFSSELKKFHQDPNLDKVFDTTIVTSNQFMQQILLNLGVVINDNGQFSLTAFEDDMNLIQQQHQQGVNFMGGISHPLQQGNMLGNNLMPLEMSFLTSMRPHITNQRGNLGPLGNGNNTGNFPMNINNFPQRFIDNRPGLLGIAPNMPFNFDGTRPNNSYNVFDEQQQLYNGMDNFDDIGGGNNFPSNFSSGNMFENHSSGGGGSGGNNYSNSGNYNSRSENRSRNYRSRVSNNNNTNNNSGDRWRNMGSSHGSNSNSRNSSSRRNYDREIRRDKSKN